MKSSDDFSPDDWGLESKDFLSLIPVDFDLRDQLDTIRSIFHRNRQANRNTIESIRECERDANRLKGSAAEQAVDDYGMQIHWAIYEDAAHGMSAIAMIAPLFETTLHRCLSIIGSRYLHTSRPNPGHPRWSATSDRIWDCHWVWEINKWRQDVNAGAKQLLEAIEVLKLLPADFLPVYTAVVAYRNKMFHHGLEWPLKDRIAFRERIMQEGWPPSWFEISGNGCDPWMFSLTDAFVDRCIEIVIILADVFGDFIRREESALAV